MYLYKVDSNLLMHIDYAYIILFFNLFRFRIYLLVNLWSNDQQCHL